jgi:hypothetical protein
MMGNDPGMNQRENSPQHKDEPALNEAGHGDEGSSDHGGSLGAGDAVAVVADEKVIGRESAGTGDLLGDDDLLGALTSLPSVPLSNIDYALDQLTTTTDLFDVPALDFPEDLPS